MTATATPIPSVAPPTTATTASGPAAKFPRTPAVAPAHEAAPESPESPFAAAIGGILTGHRGRYGVAFLDLDTSESVRINADVPMHSASLIKLPILLAVFDAVDHGRVHLDDKVTMKYTFPSSTGQGDMHPPSNVDIPEHTTVDNLVLQMVTASDNLAASNLIHVLTIPSIQAFFDRRGYAETHLTHFPMDEAAFDGGERNTTSAGDMLHMLKDVVESRGFAPASGEAMLRILLRQRIREKIPASLPGGVRAANKTGKGIGVEHDSALVFLPEGRRYILAVLSDRLASGDEGIDTSREVSAAVYKHVAETPAAHTHPMPWVFTAETAPAMSEGIYSPPKQPPLLIIQATPREAQPRGERDRRVPGVARR